MGTPNDSYVLNSNRPRSRLRFKEIAKMANQINEGSQEGILGRNMPTLGNL